MDAEVADHMRATSPQPGSREEAEALARLDELRADEIRATQRQRPRGWDGRAGTGRAPLDLEVPE